MSYIDPLSRPAHSVSNEGVGVPNSAAAIAGLNYRLTQIEKRLNLTDRPSAPLETAVWGRETPTVSTSPPWRVRVGGYIYEYVIDCRVAGGSGTTSVDLYYAAGAGAGVLIGTATMGSSARQSAPITINGYFATPGDQLWVACTSLSSGTLGLSARAAMG